MAKKLKDRLRKGVTVYGPYTRDDGRKHVILYDGEHRKTVSYPKWLKEQELGYFLGENDQVDHDDRDFTNDNLSNLKVRKRREHQKLDVIRVKRVRCCCVWCGKRILRTPSDLRYKHKKGMAGPFCSPKCKGEYGAELQNGRVSKLPTQKSRVSSYYRRNKRRGGETGSTQGS